MFTLKELNMLQDLVFRVIDECDFDEQDEDYKDTMIELESKISKERVEQHILNKKLPKYNRAFIIRNTQSLILLEYNYSGAEGEEHWLFDSKESFHGEEDGKYFYFKDSRLPVMSLPLSFVKLEFGPDEE